MNIKEDARPTLNDDRIGLKMSFMTLKQRSHSAVDIAMVVTAVINGFSPGKFKNIHATQSISEENTIHMNATDQT